MMLGSFKDIVKSESYAKMELFGLPPKMPGRAPIGVTPRPPDAMDGLFWDSQPARTIHLLKIPPLSR
jgi:hypothetical protein